MDWDHAFETFAMTIQQRLGRRKVAIGRPPQQSIGVAVCCMHSLFLAPCPQDCANFFPFQLQICETLVQTGQTFGTFSLILAALKFSSSILA